MPGKNIQPICGHPLIAWTIRCARQSSYLDHLLVSTDSKKIAAVARKYGETVPFLRPSRLSTDQAASVGVILHALRYLEALGQSFDWVVLLEPTSPLREPGDIDAALEILDRSGGAVVSVCRAESVHPQFLYTVSPRRTIRPISGVFPKRLRRQVLTSCYFPEGTVYASEVKTLQRRRSFYHKDTRALILPKWKALEVDERCDLILAEAAMRSKLFSPKMKQQKTAKTPLAKKNIRHGYYGLMPRR